MWFLETLSLFISVYSSCPVKGLMSLYFTVNFFFFFFIYKIITDCVLPLHTYCKSNKHDPLRYKQWWWCWKSICITLTKYKGQQFGSLLLRKITFPKINHPLQPSSPVMNQEGLLSQSAGLCMQIDPDGHGVQTSSPPPHRPSGWTWLPGLQMGRRAPHLWRTLDPCTP